MNSIASLPDSWQAHKRLFKMAWGTECCPDCGGRLLFRPNYEWCKACRLKTSVKAVSGLRNCKLSYRQIYIIASLWQNKAPVGQIAKCAGVSYPTVSRWLHRFRAMLPQDSLNKNGGKLAGEVEIDESFFGRIRFKTKLVSGETKSYKLVVGAIERNTGRIKLNVVTRRDMPTLEDFVSRNVEDGSEVYTDEWRGYSDLNLLGYIHTNCNHSKSIFGETNRIENLWSVIKRHLRAVYANRLNFTGQELNLILNEWEVRRNLSSIMYNVTNYFRQCLFCVS